MSSLLTFKADFAWQVERGVLPSQSILGEAPPGRQHLVERGNAVTGFELPHVGSDRVDNAGDVISSVHGLAEPLGYLPCNIKAGLFSAN